MNASIDWKNTFDYLRRLLGNPSIGAEVLADRQRLSPFQNRTHTGSCSPLLLDPRFSEAVSLAVERYQQLLVRLVACYKQQAAVRDYFALDGEIEQAILDEPEFERICIARFDGYIAAKDGSYKILEHNADSPAGTYFTSRVGEIASDTTERVLPRNGRKRFPLDSAQCFLDALLAEYASSRPEGRPTITILQPSGESNRESLALAEHARSLGYAAEVADPRNLSFQGNCVYSANGRVDLVWNKINVANWMPLFGSDHRFIRQLALSAKQRAVCNINAFAARHVLENKLSLAFFQEDRFAALLEEEGRALIRQLLPWGTKLEPGKRVRFEGKPQDLRQLVLEHPARFVIKQHYDIRGDGVTIGRSTARSAWTECVETGFERGYLVQEYITPMTVPVAFHDGDFHVSNLNFSLDSFVFRGRHVGFGSKASAQDKVNLFQGGTKIAVQTVEA
ncbi:MAG: circularly permuted type 2 ATP-grasp protein [Betaproteobacteria bacterium]